VARELAGLERLVLISGRYEGVDERVNELLCDRELSIGDYVLSGGELAAAIVVDATARLLPGVLGNEASSEFESFGEATPTSAKIGQIWGTQVGGGNGRAAVGGSWSGRVAGLSALHAAGGVSRGVGAGGADPGGPCGDPEVAEGAGFGEDLAEPAGSVGGGGVVGGGSGVFAGVGVAGTGIRD
jgi:hypothetical protein